MRENDKDPIRLLHIQDAIEKLLSEAQEYDLDQLSDKDIRFFGIVKLLEIIGEAAYKLTKEFREKHPDTPWKEIIGMRHIMVHGYYLIDPRFVSFTVKENLQPLQDQIQTYLKEFGIKEQPS